MNAQNLASQVKYDGDAIAQIMFDVLTECNFHSEVKILHTVWEAMLRCEGKPELLLIAAKKSLGDNHENL